MLFETVEEVFWTSIEREACWRPDNGGRPAFERSSCSIGVGPIYKPFWGWIVAGERGLGCGDRCMAVAVGVCALSRILSITKSQLLAVEFTNRTSFAHCGALSGHGRVSGSRW